MTEPPPPDQEPGFWCEYIAPASEVARAIQYPAPPSPWADRLITAYVADARASRKTARAITGANN